jgi:Tol biopolymer transport system component
VALVRTGRIVYESNSDKGLRGLFTVNLDGTDKKALINRVGEYEDYSPALSPDQTKVFFFSTRDGVKQDNSTSYKEALYLINLDGSNLVKVSDNAEGYNAKWAPNSKFITYVSPYTQAEGYKLRIYNVANKTITAFDDYIKVDSGTVSISTDGKLVVFSGNVKGASTSSGLFYGNVDGTSIKTIDNLSINSVEFTSSNKIRYSYYDSPSSSVKYFEYDPSANTKTAITSPAIDKVAAVVSPNGKYRAYVSTRDGRANLFVSKADGTEEVQLTTLNKVTGNILWSLDSSFIIFDYGTYGESARYLVDAAGQNNAKKIIDINASSWY